MTDKLDHLRRLGRLAASGSLCLPVIIDEKKAFIYFDTQESERFPGYIWVKVFEEKPAND